MRLNDFIRNAKSLTGSELKQQSDKKYLPHIDGLRALAVLAVFVYHLVPNLASGGYMGVDIFFVISGFLITRIIKRKAADDNFSLGEFYIRRMRRILPALIATVLMTVFLGLVVLSPDKLTELARTGIWTLPAFQISTFLISSDTLIWKLTASFCCTPGLWQLKNSSI